MKGRRALELAVLAASLCGLTACPTGETSRPAPAAKNVAGGEPALSSGSDILFAAGNGSRGRLSVSQVSADRLWPRAVIPYLDFADIQFSSDTAQSNQLKDRLRTAMDRFERDTGMRFVKRRHQPDYLRFAPLPASSPGCGRSFIGRQGGEQILYLKAGGTGEGGETCGTGQILHELGHAAGQFHESSRADRDQYVVIHSGNVRAGEEVQFQKFPEAVAMGPYDFASISHPAWNAFASDPSQPTITRAGVSSPADRTGFGQREELSLGDRKLYRALYGDRKNCAPGEHASYYVQAGSSSTNEVHVVAVWKGVSSPSPTIHEARQFVSVRVYKTPLPAILVLNARMPLDWRVELAPEANVARIVLDSGKYLQDAFVSRTDGSAPPAIPITRHSSGLCGYGWRPGEAPAPCSFHDLIQSVRTLWGTESSYQGCPTGVSFDIPFVTYQTDVPPNS